MQKIKDRNTGNKPPKKPASAYILFQKEVSFLFLFIPLKNARKLPSILILFPLQKRAEILRRSPKAKVTEVVKEIAKCWRALHKEERMPYRE